MTVLILIGSMVLAGILVALAAGVIWKDNRPIGVQGDYIVSILSTVIIGLLDWYVIPAMGFSDSLKYIGVAVEPVLGAFFVLWIIRRARK
jgi:hypothetical protein